MEPIESSKYHGGVRDLSLMPLDNLFDAIEILFLGLDSYPDLYAVEFPLVYVYCEIGTQIVMKIKQIYGPQAFRLAYELVKYYEKMFPL